MVGRRHFIFAAGATAVVPLVTTTLTDPAFPATASKGGHRLRIDLAGQWERFYAGAFYDRIPVPSSQRPVGFFSLRRQFVRPPLSSEQRAILHFDAITYYAKISMNGSPLGTMGPYLPYEFDFTAHAKQGDNHAQVDIVDLASGPDGEGKDEVALGVSMGGWEAYGGIIRNVFMLRCGLAFSSIMPGSDTTSTMITAKRIAERRCLFLPARQAQCGLK
jgi:hypothetical protein